MKTRRAALFFVLITVAFDMIAVGIIIPVLPTLILNLLGGSASRAVEWLGIFATVFALMQFFFMPVLGVISDRVGRRPVILLSNVGLGLDLLCHGFGADDRVAFSRADHFWNHGGQHQFSGGLHLGR